MELTMNVHTATLTHIVEKASGAGLVFAFVVSKMVIVQNLKLTTLILAMVIIILYNFTSKLIKNKMSRA